MRLGASRVDDGEPHLRPRRSSADDALLDHKLGVARELLLRDLQAQMRHGPVMESPQALRDWLRLYCAGLEHEVFLVLYLNANHALIEAVQLFRGTLTQTSVYPREVVKGALSATRPPSSWRTTTRADKPSPAAPTSS